VWLVHGSAGLGVAGSVSGCVAVAVHSAGLGYGLQGGPFLPFLWLVLSRSRVAGPEGWLVSGWLDCEFTGSLGDSITKRAVTIMERAVSE
jgi:hypothetical protein